MARKMYDGTRNELIKLLYCRLAASETNISCGGGSSSDGRTYTKSARDKFLKGSLDDVSKNPFGEFAQPQESSLRRCRSLAISREDIFTNLDIRGGQQQHRRSQLIPRAKLIGRSSVCIKERPERSLQQSQEQIPIEPSSKQQPKRKSSTSSDYIAIPPPSSNAARKQQQQQQTTGGNLINPSYFRHEEGSAFVQVNNFLPSLNCSEIDSLDSNSQNKTSASHSSQYPLVSYSNSFQELGLSLPNYYPDTKYDTDVSVNDNVSNVSLNEEPSPLFDGKPSSLPNFTVTIDYDSDYEPNYYEPIKRLQDSPNNQITSTKFEEIKLHGYGNVHENIEENGTDNFHLKFPEILPSNHNRTQRVAGKEHKQNKKNKNVEQDTKHNKQDKNKAGKQELNGGNVVIDKKGNKKNGAVYSVIKKNDKGDGNPECKDVGSKEINNNNNGVGKSQKSPKEEKKHNYLREFLETQKSNTKPFQNFLSKTILSRAFGESYLKRNDKLTSSLRTESSLLDNQYHSLPDITVSKNLRKCEKIDRKLRKCEKTPSVKAAANDNSKNRFIVNIGQHFDVALPENKKPPAKVDFEVKITKVQTKDHKINEVKSTADSSSESDKAKRAQKESRDGKKDITFLEAVKNLKETLNGSAYSHNGDTDNAITVKNNQKRQESYDNFKQKTDSKLDKLKSIKTLPKIKEETAKESSIEYVQEIDRIAEVKSLQKGTNMDERNREEQSGCGSVEFRDKLGNMRNYWDKMTGQRSPGSEGQPERVTEHEPKKQSSCKIVDVHTKIEDVIRKFEPSSQPNGEQNEPQAQSSIVQKTKHIFEPRITNTPERNDRIMSKFVKDTCGIFQNPFFDNQRFHDDTNMFESLSPQVVELIEKEESAAQSNKEAGDRIIVSDNKIEKPKRILVKNGKNDSQSHKVLTKSQSYADEPEFDHVRYRVIKSDLFQKSIFANCHKEKQFDGLMQYLQDYSFQELLIDNNVVIIEPIRTKIQYQDSPKSARNVTKYIHKPVNASGTNKQSGLRHHFFYHPIRVNREVNDDELPNPDTVKQVREFFEGGLKKSQSTNGLDELKVNKSHHVQYQAFDPDRDRCSEPDSYSPLSGYCSDENLYETLNEEFCCARQYVSEDVLKKIRDCGTSVTYYGGKVLNKRTGEEISPMTKAIMEEIRGSQKRNKECHCKNGEDGKNKTERTRCRVVEDQMIIKGADCNSNNKDAYQGVKFKLVKSNSCSSRLELVGTENFTEYRKKFMDKHKSVINERNLKNQMRNSSKIDVIPENETCTTPDVNNYDSIEYVKQQHEAKDDKEKDVNDQNNKECPKKINVVAAVEEKKPTEKKMTQWGEIKEEKTYANITFSKGAQKINYDFRGYETSNVRKPKKLDEMEFETYEIAGNYKS